MLEKALFLLALRPLRLGQYFAVGVFGRVLVRLIHSVLNQEASLGSLLIGLLFLLLEFLDDFLHRVRARFPLFLQVIEILLEIQGFFKQRNLWSNHFALPSLGLVEEFDFLLRVHLGERKQLDLVLAITVNKLIASKKHSVLAIRGVFEEVLVFGLFFGHQFCSETVLRKILVLVAIGTEVEDLHSLHLHPQLLQSPLQLVVVGAVVTSGSQGVRHQGV